MAAEEERGTRFPLTERPTFRLISLGPDNNTRQGFPRVKHFQITFSPLLQFLLCRRQIVNKLGRLKFTDFFANSSEG